MGVRRRILHNPRLPFTRLLHSHTVLLHSVHDFGAYRRLPHLDVLLLQPRPRQVLTVAPKQRRQSRYRRLLRLDSRDYFRGQRRQQGLDAVLAAQRS